MPVRSGTVVGQWGTPSDALPDPPAWAEPGVMWSPDVARFGDHYILYFSTMVRNVSPGLMCIGDAVSTAVGGPYIASPVPFVCQQTLGGSIDPRVFVDSTGQPYMIWKSEQNARSLTVDTQIWSQPLSADGMHLVGPPRGICVRLGECCVNAFDQVGHVPSNLPWSPVCARIHEPKCPRRHRSRIPRRGGP